MKDFYFNYSFNWEQDYPHWEEFVDSLLEVMIKSSDMKEALEVIERVKK